MTAKVGRPSKYPSKPEAIEELHDWILALGSEGKSIIQISARTNIPKTTLLRWADNYPEFRTILTRAKELEQAWWEDRAQAALENKDFNGNLWIKSMSVRFRSEYGDKLQLSGDKDNPVQLEVTHVRDSLSRKLTRIAANTPARDLAEQPDA